MRNSPLLSAAIIVTLAVGVGIDVGVFALVNGALFKPRVLQDPDRFIQVTSRSTTADLAVTVLTSLQDYHAFGTEAGSFAALAAWTPIHATIAGSTTELRADRSVPLLVSCNFFTVYGSDPPLAGRVFRPDECDEARPVPVVVIGETLWRVRLGARPNIVGSTIAIDRRPFTVVGVMPSGYSGHLRTDVWIPYGMAAAFYGGRDLVREPAKPWLMAMAGRLRPGASWESARAELTAIAARQDRLVPGRSTVVHLSNGSLIESDAVETMAFWIVPVILGALTLVVLLVCANVTTLLLSRAAARRQEMAIRISLGGTRRRLMAMLLTDSVILALFAAPLAALVSYAIAWGFRRQEPMMPVYPFGADATVWAYLCGTTFVAGIAAGLAPALESLKRDVAASLHRYDAPMRRIGKWHVRDLLIAVQVAVSLALVISAGLFVRAELRVAEENPGYDAARVVHVAPRVRMPPYTPSTAAVFYSRLAERARAIPSVRGVAFSSAAPFGGGDSERHARAPVFLTASNGSRIGPIAVNEVSREYFAVLGLVVVRGGFAEADGNARVTPAALSASVARALFPNRDPMGEVLRDESGHAWEITGVVRDISTPASKGVDLTLYSPRPANAVGDAMVVRFDHDPHPVADAIRKAIMELDPDAIAEPRTLAALRDDAADRLLRLVRMILVLAGAALVLALIGVYGVVAFAVRVRSHEFGIHMALGATRGGIFRLVLSSGLKPIAYGAAAGVTLSLAASIALTQIFRDAPVPLDPRDPVVYVAVAALLGAAAVIAMIGPACRAAWADPALVLRHD